MAGRNFQVAIDRARYLTNDTSSTPRITTTEFEAWCNDAIETMYDMRPDIFYGLHSDTFPPDIPYVAANAIPIGNRWIPHIVDYLVFRAQMKDDEHVIEERAGVAAQFFQKRLA